MPEIRIIRKGITPAVRKVPTSTCAAVMPMTLERVGKEVALETEELERVESVAEAFASFQPKLSFTGYAGEDETEFKAEFRFQSMKDFDPENLQKRQNIKNEAGEPELLRNDIAELKSNIDLLYRFRDRWKLPAVRRAWASAGQRKEIIDALTRLRIELERVSVEGGKR